MKKLAVRFGMLGAMALILFLLDFFAIGCPIRALSGIPCPACGTTRALFSLLRLDLNGYLYYNPMAAPLALAFVIVLFCEELHIPKRLYHIILILIAAAAFAVYLFRLVTQTIP